MNFGPLAAKIGPKFSPTLLNNHLLGGGVHHVGLPLGVPTFLVGFVVDLLYNKPQQIEPSGA